MDIWYESTLYMLDNSLIFVPAQAGIIPCSTGTLAPEDKGKSYGGGTGKPCKHTSLEETGGK